MLDSGKVGQGCFFRVCQYIWMAHVLEAAIGRKHLLWLRLGGGRVGWRALAAWVTGDRGVSGEKKKQREKEKKKKNMHVILLLSSFF